VSRLFAPLLVLAGCGTTGPTERLWPDRSDVLAEARATASAGERITASLADPAPAVFGIATWTTDDPLATTWTRLAEGHPAAPQAVLVTGPEVDDLLPPAQPTAARTREQGSRDILAHIQAGRLDCGRLPSDRFLQAALGGVPLVAVAAFSRPDDAAPGFTLLRAPGVPAEAPREMVGRAIGVLSIEPFPVAAAQDWMRSVGLRNQTAKLKRLPETTDPQAALTGDLDYLFLPAAEADRVPGTNRVDVTSQMASADLYRDYLVCARTHIADHRRDIVAQVARWIEREPTSAPESIPRATLQTLSQLLRRTGAIRASVKVKSILDSRLIEEATQRARAQHTHTHD